MDKRRIKLIEDLTVAPGASGFEEAVAAAALAYVEENGCAVPQGTDSLGNLYLDRIGNTGDKPVVMLDAHSDEVGFMVKAINPNGTLGFITLGGIRSERHEGQRVKVRSASGAYVPGVISCRPPHFAKDGGSQGLVIDIGATSAKEAKEVFGMRVGEPVTPDVPFHYDEASGLIFTKALDCRIGCAAVITVLEQMVNEALAVDVKGVLSTQEEIGDRGALVAANTVKPVAAIVFEGAPADDTFAPDHEIQTALKKGPMLRLIDVSMVTNPRFARFAIDLAEELDIPLQVAVRSGGGTNGGPIHITGAGVPCIVLSVPVRYIHSPNGIAAAVDFKNTVKLAEEILRRLDGETISKF